MNVNASSWVCLGSHNTWCCTSIHVPREILSLVFLSGGQAPVDVFGFDATPEVTARLGLTLTLS